MILPIITLPDPILRKKARKLSKVTPEVRDLIDNMVETMRDAPGVGLAAPQINVSERVIVVEYTEGSEDTDAPEVKPKLYTLVNPEIVRHNNDVVSGTEGCLSIPGYMGDVDRYTRVTVKALNRQGDPVKIKANGWLARVFQHEIDHLDGILYVDRSTQMYELKEGEESEEMAV